MREKNDALAGKARQKFGITTYLDVYVMILCVSKIHNPVRRCRIMLFDGSLREQTTHMAGAGGMRKQGAKQHLVGRAASRGAKRLLHTAPASQRLRTWAHVAELLLLRISLHSASTATNRL